MRSFDFAPYYRSTVGFDRLFSMLDQVGGVEGSAPGYPPYNIARTGENDYRISVAVAGFTDADLAIEAKENTLTLRGEKQTNDEEKSGDVLYQGIAARNFERSFQLADHVQVKGASLENGLLHIDLVREIPEAMKPRAIPIASSDLQREGWNGGRYGVYYDLHTWRRYVSAAGFVELCHYYRPVGLRRERQPWLATVWRR
jgi:molecular chaperone IbpA